MTRTQGRCSLHAERALAQALTCPIGGVSASPLSSACAAGSPTRSKPAHTAAAARNGAAGPRTEAERRRGGSMLSVVSAPSSAVEWGGLR